MQVSTLFPSDLDFNDKAKLGSIISAVSLYLKRCYLLISLLEFLSLIDTNLLYSTLVY